MSSFRPIVGKVILAEPINMGGRTISVLHFHLPGDAEFLGLCQMAKDHPGPPLFLLLDVAAALTDVPQEMMHELGFADARAVAEAVNLIIDAFDAVPPHLAQALRAAN